MSAFNYFTSVILNRYKQLYRKEKKYKQFLETYRELMLKLKNEELVVVHRHKDSY